VVFPDAEVKFYLDADPALRARRRHAELARAGVAVPLEAVEREVRERDHIDTHRPVSPLAPAQDAIYLDTSRLSPEEVVEQMLARFPLPPRA
ncbi:MAG TPA: (d)CMP kinase, partial [Vicinamibacteria bacterium]|nr:(d)CMP kinase [Vicinamibacteria bacterium]